MPRCASSALSTLRTVLLGCTSSVVRRWISSTAPLAPATMRALTTPGRVASSSSARLMGSTIPAIGDASPECGELTGRDNELLPRGKDCRVMGGTVLIARRVQQVGVDRASGGTLGPAPICARSQHRARVAHPAFPAFAKPLQLDGVSSPPKQCYDSRR